MKGGVKDEEGGQEETETSADRQMVTETGRQEATCTTKNRTSGRREGGRMDSFAWRGKKITQVWEHKDEVGAALTVSKADIIWEHNSGTVGEKRPSPDQTHNWNTPDQNNTFENWRQF